jgi:hypothetical protein
MPLGRPFSYHDLHEFNLSTLQVQCACSTHNSTRGCHWFPRQLASSEHACDQCLSSQVFTHLTGWHCKLRLTTAGMYLSTAQTKAIDTGFKVLALRGVSVRCLGSNPILQLSLL